MVDFKPGDVVHLVEDGNGYIRDLVPIHGYIGIVQKCDKKARWRDTKDFSKSSSASVLMLATGHIEDVIWFTQMEKADVQEG